MFATKREIAMVASLDITPGSPPQTIAELNPSSSQRAVGYKIMLAADFNR